MKFKILFLFILFQGSLSHSANLLGDRVGNGGGLWTCSNFNSLIQGILVDLYEAEVEFGLNLISPHQTDPMQIVAERSSFVQKNLPEYFFQWERVLTEIKSKLRFVNSELTVIDDALYRVKPLSTTCPSRWEYTQFANFTELDYILIRNDLWLNANIKSLHKAALIWHEVIYTWLRREYKDQNSVRTRQIVGLLFSDLPPLELKARIEKIFSNVSPKPGQPMWICTVENSHIHKLYSGYGSSKLDASSKALINCKNGDHAFFCSTTSNCEVILDQTKEVVCRVENRLSHKAFVSKGRNLLEAQFKATEQCQLDVGASSFHCGEPVCE